MQFTFSQTCIEQYWYIEFYVQKHSFAYGIDAMRLMLRNDTDFKTCWLA